MLIRDVSNERGGEKKKDAGRKRLTSPFEMSHGGKSKNLVIVFDRFLFSFFCIAVQHPPSLWN